jgi:glycosyltransferase involved in cell wall biosynthesis
MKNPKTGISILIPCHNEADSIQETVGKIIQVMTPVDKEFEIIVINDGSTDNSLEKLNEITLDTLKVLNNEENLGYGSSLKNGIKESKYPWIGIVDADGTYPVERFPDFLNYCDECDMVIGVRTGKIRAIPLIRRPAKWFLNRFSSYMVNRKIEDVNSGMRIFKKELALKYWNLFPEGFSFTTTLTLSSIMGNHKIKNLSIDYMKRKGKSKIHPIKDTYNFVLLILRIIMLFNPLRISMPIFFFSTFLTVLSIARDIYILNLTDTTVILFIFSIIILMIGLLADLINKKIPL